MEKTTKKKSSKKKSVEKKKSNTQILPNMENTVFENMTVDEVCDYLLEVDGMAIINIEKSNQTREMAFNAVKQNGLSIPYVNKRFWNIDLFRDAIDSNIKAFNEIIKYQKYISPELLSYMTISPDRYDLIPSEYRTEDINIKAVRRSNETFAKMTADQQTVKVILTALHNEVSQVVNTKDMTHEKFIAILSQYPEAIGYIWDINFADDKDYKGTDGDYYRLHAINVDPDCLKCIAHAFQTDLICKTAVKLKSSTIKYVSPIFYYDKEAGCIFDAIEDDVENLFLVAPGYWAVSLIDKAVSIAPGILYIILETLSDYGEDYNKFISDKAWLYGIQYKPDLIKKMPRDRITFNQAREAISVNPFLIGNIPTHIQTLNMQKEVIKKDLDAYYYIEKPYFRIKLLYVWLRFINFIK